MDLNTHDIYIRVLRAERRWSQADLAERLGVSRQTVNAVETEKYEPSLSLALKMARLFDMRIEDIFTPEEGRSRLNYGRSNPSPEST